MRYALTIGFVAGLAYGQAAVIFSVTDPRPLAQAAEAFETHYGIPVSYEDANYAYAGDLDDKTAPEYAKSHPGGRRALIPKGGSLTLRGDPKLAVHSAQDAMPLLQSLLDDHKKAGHPGEFKLIPNGDGVAIVPSAVKNAGGILLPDHSLLETKISLPELQRTADGTIQAICEAVQTNSGKIIGLASSPFQGIQPYSVTIGASNEPARSVLERTFESLGFAEPGHVGHIAKASWSLLYAPGSNIYALNLRQVRVEVPSPAGGKVKRPVFR
jgi:hypothetical protein